MAAGHAQELEESARVLRLRFDEARQAGLSIAEARLIAESDTDLRLLRLLVAGRCEPPLIARILI